MFANSGKISFVDLLKSLYDLKNPAQKFYKAIILNLRTHYVERIIGDIMSNRTPS